MLGISSRSWSLLCSYTLTYQRTHHSLKLALNLCLWPLNLCTRCYLHLTCTSWSFQTKLQHSIFWDPVLILSFHPPRHDPCSKGSIAPELNIPSIWNIRGCPMCPCSSLSSRTSTYHLSLGPNPGPGIWWSVDRGLMNDKENRKQREEEIKGMKGSGWRRSWGNLCCHEPGNLSYRGDSHWPTNTQIHPSLKSVLLPKVLKTKCSWLFGLKPHTCPHKRGYIVGLQVVMYVGSILLWIGPGLSSHLQKIVSEGKYLLNSNWAHRMAPLRAGEGAEKNRRQELILSQCLGVNFYL